MPVQTSYEGELAQQLSYSRTKGQIEAKKHRPPRGCSIMVVIVITRS